MVPLPITTSMEYVTMASRFEFRGKYAMRVVKGKGSLLAYFNVVDTEIGIEFRDVRLIEGKNGVFVAAPFRSYEQNNETKFADYWRAAYNEADEARDERGVAYVEELAKAAYAFYQTQDGATAAGEGGSSSRSGSKSVNGGGERRSARGPVPTVDHNTRTSGGAKAPKLPF